MAATVVQGVRNTSQANTETRRKRDVTASLQKLEPNAAPLVTLLSKLRSRAATDPKIEWFEDELLPRFDVLGGSLTAVATTMTVTNYKYFRAGDLVRVNKKEIVRVSTTPTTTTVTISRAAGETAAQAASQNDQLHILSNSNQEGATRRSLLSTQKVPQYNYCQIIRTPFGVTNTEDATETYAGKDMNEERANSLIEHKKDLEYAFLFGERFEDTSGTHPMRGTRGITKFISTNVKNVAQLTEPEFEDWLRVCFRYGGREKLILCSPKLIQIINAFGREKLETRTDEKTYGITMTKYQNAGRVVMLVEHPLFTNDSLNDLTGIAGYGLLLDIGDLEMRYLKGRQVSLKENIQANDEDSRIDEYISEVGLEAHLEKKHGLLTGVQS